MDPLTELSGFMRDSEYSWVGFHYPEPVFNI